MKIRFDTPPVSAQHSNGLAVRYAAAKREVPRWRWYLMLALIGVPLLYFAWRFVVAVWWETAPGFVVVPTLTVKASSSGTVRSIAATGSAVERGAALVVVDPPAAGTPAAPPKNGANVATAPVTPPVAGAAGSDARGAVLDEALALTQRTLVFRRERLAAIDALKRDGAATQPEADAARAAVAQAEADVLRARGERAAYAAALAEQSAARARGAAAGRAPPAAAHAATESAAESAAESASPAAGPVIVASPYAGTVTDALVVPGEYVTASTDMLLLQGRDAPFVEAYVAPTDAKFARVGRRATLRFFDGGRIDAVVSEVAAQTSRIPAERVGPLSPRTQAIVVRMRPAGELPARYRINVLPLDVRFDTLWPWSD